MGSVLENRTFRVEEGEGVLNKTRNEKFSEGKNKTPKTETTLLRFYKFYRFYF